MSSKQVSRRSVPGLIAAILLLTGTALNGILPARAQHNPMRIVASFSILADIAANVAGDAAIVETLIPVGSNPHAYEPSARDVVTLSEADAVLIVGAGFEENLLPVLEEASQDKTTIVSTCVPLRPVVSRSAAVSEPTGEHALADDDPCQDHYAAASRAFNIAPGALLQGTLGPLHTLNCGDHAHDEDSDQAEDEPQPASCDPHVWTDPVNAGLWTLTIRDTLIALDPANAATYAANADAYLAELGEVMQQISDLMETIPAARRYLITNHLAFNYFAARFGLTLVGVIIPGGSTTSEPSVQEILGLVDTIQQYNVPAIFTETTVSDDLARQLSEETGATIESLYTGSLSLPDQPADTYLNYLLFNATQIANALK